MRISLKIALLFAGVAVGLTRSGSQAGAAFVVAPNANTAAEGNNGNIFPFGVVGGFRYQQVFGASQFASLAGPQLVTDIRFRLDGGSPAYTSTFPSLRIDLSTTAAAVGGLSTTFAANVGANNATVFNGPLTLSSAGGSTPGSFDLVITLATPFLYNPAAGNLLLDIRKAAGGAGATAGYDSVSGSGVTSRAYGSGENATTASGTDGDGLVTGFTFTPAAVTTATPAPAGALVLAAAAGLLGLARRLRPAAA